MEAFYALLTVESLIAFVTLAALEIVLGIDNIVLIAILSNKLPAHEQDRARKLGLLGAMVMRIILLLGIGFVMRLTNPWFSVWGHGVTGKDLVMIVGGLFLLGKATYEIHHKLEGPSEHGAAVKAVATLRSVLITVLLMDMVFSLDSVITAVGMVTDVPIMIAAVIVAVLVMLKFAGTISRFVERHPTIKMLALAFMLLIGVILVAEGIGSHIPKGYVYFAMAFSLLVEMLNIRAAKFRKPAS